jgi:AcrR family transcriptional regulator
MGFNRMACYMALPTGHTQKHETDRSVTSSGVTVMIPPGAKSAAAPHAGAPPPRERILAAARDLFYRRGIHAVGVDAIADAAGTNKMTLYRHFASKDVLVAECLRESAREIDAEWEAIAAAHPGDPRGQLLAWLQHVAGWFTREAGRGCALANAAIELPDQDHPARRVVREHKSAVKQRLANLCRDAGLSDPEALADECFLLCEGARVAAQTLASDAPLNRLPTRFKELVQEHTPPRHAKRGHTGHIAERTLDLP